MNEPTMTAGLREHPVTDDDYGERAPVGRDRECALLDGLLESLPERGAALLLRGDPGIGKTRLLDHLAERARDGVPVAGSPRKAPVRVLRARGIESEAVLPYTVLADLLLPLRSHFAGLPSSRRRALETCFALLDADEPNPYAVCAGTLGVLAAAGEAGPLLVLVDDLHWADPESRRALQFVARRLARERVALVMAARPAADDETTWEDVPRLTVAPLAEDDSRRLLERHGVDPAEPAVTRLVTLSSGNPLVLVEYATALVDARKHGGELADTAWEMPGPLVERAWWGRIRALPYGTRTALVYVAACRTPELALLEKALSVNGLSLGILEEAEESGLIRALDDGYELRHPVLRPLVFGHCSLAQRLRAYRTLADLSAGDERTWYL
ncbi:AAA family ATPase, partial [Streptomyces sp. NPDC057757]|uniref:AAA family ATPase n=1 Tax=Streptomyces sp. NPDC057757 TaxID=3346241 RepID=UPI0036A544BE